MSTVLVTGGTGCIGAVTVRDLLARGAARVVVATRTSDPGRLRFWLGDQLDTRLLLERADIGERDSLANLVRAHRPDRVLHLGALQSPDCDTDPERGMRINVGGTLALLAACEQLGSHLQRLVFASSAAVYGPRALYPGPVVREDAPLEPPNRYGVWKVAGEHLLRQFQLRTGVPAVCLRLNTTYGPGRDLGVTSAPTMALKCVAAGSVRGAAMPFRMPYQGRENYHWVEDVGAHFAAAALDPFEGFGACNVRGTTVEVVDFLAVLQQVAAELGIGRFADVGIAGDARPNLFVSDLDEARVRQRFPGVPKTPLETGVRRSLVAFQRLWAAGGPGMPR